MCEVRQMIEIKWDRDFAGDYGMWVCRVGGRFVSSGRSPEEALAAARCDPEGGPAIIWEERA